MSEMAHPDVRAIALQAPDRSVAGPRPVRAVALTRRPIGRDEELAVIGRVLAAGARLVTVLGPAGIGKTRIVDALVEALSDAAAGAVRAVYVCRLGPERELPGVVQRVARSLGLGDAREANDPVAVGEALAARGACVLVLDHLEPVLPEASAYLERWLMAAPDATILVTSRSAVGLAAEQLIEIGPLAVPPPEHDLASPAVDLLIETVRAFRHDYAPDQAERLVLGALARQLDGIPLAIQLAGARLRVLSLAELLARIDDAGCLLGGPSQVLERAVGVSWDMLDPHEQAAFARCAVFRGGFTLADAEAVVALPGAPPAIDLLHALRDRSLLHGASEPGLLGMYAPLRAFAIARLAERGDRDELIARHARHFIARAALAGGSPSVRDNLRVALAALLDTLPPPRGLVLDAVIALDVACGGQLAAGDAALIDRALALSDAAEREPRTWSAALRVQAGSLLLAGRLDEAELVLRRVLAQRGEVRDDEAERAARRDLAEVMFAQGRMADALRACDQASKLTSPRTSRAEIYRSERLRSAVLGSMGRLDEARATLAKLASESDDDAPRALVDTVFAGVLLETGDVELAIERYARAIPIHRRLGAHRSEALCLGYLGIAELAAARPGAALARLQAAIRLTRHVGHVRAIGLFSAAAAAAAAQLGQLAAAEPLIRDARKLLGGDPVLGHVAAAFEALIELASASATGEISQADHIAVVERLVALRAARMPPTRAGELGVRLAAVSDDARVVAQILVRALAAVQPSRGAGDQRTRLTIAAGAGWFTIADAPRVNLDGRPITQALLWALCVAQLRQPGVALTTQQLVAAVWAGDTLPPRVAASRLYVAMRELRKLGLGALVTSNRDGYALAADIVISLA
jgi:predicted ATPase